MILNKNFYLIFIKFLTIISKGKQGRIGFSGKSGQKGEQGGQGPIGKCMNILLSLLKNNTYFQLKMFRVRRIIWYKIYLFLTFIS
jgi:hypothetical protein